MNIKIQQTKQSDKHGFKFYPNREELSKTTSSGKMSIKVFLGEIFITINLKVIAKGFRTSDEAVKWQSYLIGL